MQEPKSSFLNREPDKKDFVEIEKLLSLGDIVAGIVHELNNPLSSILGYAEILQALDIDPLLKRYVNHIHLSAIRSTKIIEGLLTFLRKRDIVCTTEDINTLILQTVTLFEYQMRKSGVALVILLKAGKPLVRGDAYRLQQVFFNLFMNSLQALDQWGKERQISILSTRAGENIRIEFHDSGPGIDPSCREKIFAPFYTTKPDGTGLGLSIVYGIVKEHGGTITVLPQGSEHQGGCTFVIDLPRACEVAGLPDGAVAGVSGETAVVVGNDELIIDSLCIIQSQLGCDLVFTTSPVEAIRQLGEAGASHVFFDCKTAEMGYAEFVRKISGLENVKHLVLITGDASLDLDIVERKRPVSVLQKPVGLDELKRILTGDS